MRMRIVESVADGFHCETHGMIQNMVDQMPTNFHQNRALIHQHRQQTRHQHNNPANRNRANRVTPRQMVRDWEIEQMPFFFKENKR